MPFLSPRKQRGGEGWEAALAAGLDSATTPQVHGITHAPAANVEASRTQAWSYSSLCCGGASCSFQEPPPSTRAGSSWGWEGTAAWLDPETEDAKDVASESGRHGTRSPDLASTLRGEPGTSFSEMREEEEDIVPTGWSRGTARRVSLSAGALPVRGGLGLSGGPGCGHRAWAGTRVQAPQTRQSLAPP